MTKPEGEPIEIEAVGAEQSWQEWILMNLALVPFVWKLLGGVIVGSMLSTAFLGPDAAGIIMICGLILCVLVAAWKRAMAPPEIRPTRSHIGFTHDGEPVYPVTGYTADGRAVTSDKFVANPSYNFSTRTNSLAIAALVCGFVFAPLAIVFGHISLGQIRRTGEQGHGLAVLGLVLGYFWVIVVAAVLMSIT
ncbi:DUF4190 domain-containing protein [Rhodococcus sp. NPDC057135]|uniref:DUF4190 domain-containing protein n=1 Tax=Rhodococcus sp. NPDC057135 TaxID=3346028 RepID=UPI00362E8432